MSRKKPEGPMSREEMALKELAHDEKMYKMGRITRIQTMWRRTRSITAMNPTSADSKRTKGTRRVA